MPALGTDVCRCWTVGVNCWHCKYRSLPQIYFAIGLVPMTKGILRESPLPPGTDSVNAPPSTKLWGRGNYILKEELIGGTAIAFLSITDVHSCIYLQADIALRLLFGNLVHTEELFANSSDLCNSREWYAVFCGLWTTCDMRVSVWVGGAFMIHKACPCLVSFQGWSGNEANPCDAPSALTIPCLPGCINKHTVRVWSIRTLHLHGQVDFVKTLEYGKRNWKHGKKKIVLATVLRQELQLYFILFLLNWLGCYMLGRGETEFCFPTLHT